MNLIDQANELIAAGTAFLPAESVTQLAEQNKLSLDELMLRLIPLAATFSQPPLSDFRVGAVGLGSSGVLYFGANFEFPRCSLNQSVHAEQAVVINAVSHRETGLTKLAVSAPPCGYCRQFLFELATADDLEILLKDEPVRKLADYLPGAFGPRNLGIEGGLMDSQRHPLSWTDVKPRAVGLAGSLLETAAGSYAPYTNTLAAVNLSLPSGESITAPYLENAAFNPSIPPLQVGLVLLGLAGHSTNDIAQVHVAQQQGSVVNHAAAARHLLAENGLEIPVREYLFEPPKPKESTMAKKPLDQSFYFFDFDDNIMFLKTPILLRNVLTGKTKTVSTSKFAGIRATLGQPGDWEDFEQYPETYSRFRDIPADKLRKNQQQYFVADVKKEISKKTAAWQALSWKLFQYACENQRPLAVVTARGHSPETIKAGIRELYKAKLIKKEPNWLAIYAVGNDEVRQELFDSLDDNDERKYVEKIQKQKQDPTSAYKRIAIRHAVEAGLTKYGTKPEHRFGMSDDDPENVDLIVKAMCDCKNKHLDKRFFVINTHRGEWVKLEIFPVDYPVTSQPGRDRYVV